MYTLCHKDQMLDFNVDELLASSGTQLDPEINLQAPADVVSISKLAEGGFNRTFIDILTRSCFLLVNRSFVKRLGSDHLVLVNGVGNRFDCGRLIRRPIDDYAAIVFFAWPRIKLAALGSSPLFSILSGEIVANS
ncbi:hypothetical protein BDP27DRAFT_1364354 [Rhodocollybia butyracea]|uniref:Uncharacterized protein n=1 Tax=Rhodocollybia butyracea TaxID=206335 RepID=A0A9P5PRU8_9AGAR|nr:hypothetical protein BDP27DRAFT_1364354 [Rhodocollybia butyracea]